MRFIPSNVCIPFLLAAAIASAGAKSEQPRILFIGNSYTGQIKKTVIEMIAASPHSDAKLEFITPGGRTLQQHLENPETVARIREGDWDFVVLQDQSQTPAVFPDRFAAAAEALDKIINETGAQTVFYMTWGRRDGDKQNADRFPTYAKMQDALSKAYSKGAEKTEAKVATRRRSLASCARSG